MDEHNIQRLIVAWFRDKYPKNQRVFFAIPNGGKRDPATAKRLRDEGVLPGVPDLCLAVPVGKFHGLYVEMKTKTGKVKQEQRDTHEALRENGYVVDVAHSYEDAKAAISNYLNGEYR